MAQAPGEDGPQALRRRSAVGTAARASQNGIPPCMVREPAQNAGLDASPVLGCASNAWVVTPSTLASLPFSIRWNALSLANGYVLVVRRMEVPDPHSERL